MMRLIRKKMFCRWGFHAPLMDVTFDRNHGTIYQCQNCYTLLKNWRLGGISDDARDRCALAVLIFMMLLSGAAWHAQIEAERIVAESEFTISQHDYGYHRFTLPHRKPLVTEKRDFETREVIGQRLYYPHWCEYENRYEKWFCDRKPVCFTLSCVF